MLSGQKYYGGDGLCAFYAFGMIVGNVRRLFGKLKSFIECTGKVSARAYAHTCTIPETIVWKILMIREGGLASHGGAIGVLLAMWWYVHKYGKKYGFGYIQIIDRLVIPVCFAGMMIRLGNLMNSEIYGTCTDLPWGFIFVRDPWADGLPHHPTQIYEALSYCILGLILLWLYRTRLDKLHTGTIFGIFLIVLFGMRFLIEFIKQDQSAFEAGMVLNMGQWLSVPFILTGILLLIWSAEKGAPTAIQPSLKPRR